MADSFVQLATDGAGKKIDTRTEGSNSEHRQVMVIGDPATNAGVAPVDATKGLAVDLTATGTNTNALKVDGSASTQPVSAVSLPLPTGAATAIKQPALGTAGTASADVITVQGIASMTALKVDASVAAVPVTDNSGSLTVDNGGTFAVQATQSGTWSSVGVVGAAAHNAAVSGNPLLTGAEARMSLGTAVTEGNAVRVAATRYGFLLITSIAPSHASSNGTPIIATTTSVISAPSAGNHLRILRIHISNGGSTATWVAIRDGAAGTRHYNTYLPQGGVISINLNYSGPLDLTTATRLDIFMSAAGSVEYEIDYLTVAD